MTKKRFTLTFDDKIVDNLTGIIHDVHSGYDVAMDLSGLLNELNDENEQLQHIVGEQGVQLDFLKDENQHMRSVLEENKELKQQIQQDIDDIRLCQSFIIDKGYSLQDLKEWEDMKMEGYGNG